MMWKYIGQYYAV